MKTKAIHTLLTMMMVATIIMVWSRATQADMLIIESAYELRASQVALPSHGNAPLTIRTCANCDARVLRVDGDTTYFADSSAGPALGHREFMETVAPLLDDDSALFIFFRADDGTVTRIVARATLQ